MVPIPSDQVIAKSSAEPSKKGYNVSCKIKTLRVKMNDRIVLNVTQQETVTILEKLHFPLCSPKVKLRHGHLKKNYLWPVKVPYLQGEYLLQYILPSKWAGGMLIFLDKCIKYITSKVSECLLPYVTTSAQSRCQHPLGAHYNEKELVKRNQHFICECGGLFRSFFILIYIDYIND